MQIKQSSWRNEWPKLASMLQRHGYELGEAHIVLDSVSIAELDEKGALSITVAKTDASESESESGELAGYCMWFLGPDLSRMGETCAQMGPFYVAPEYRRSGLARELLLDSLAHLRSRHIWKAFPHFYEKSPDLSGMFASLGGVPYERTFLIDLRKQIS